jgi:hypothetical protein
MTMNMVKRLSTAVGALVVLGLATPALADGPRDHRGHRDRTGVDVVIKVGDHGRGYRNHRRDFRRDIITPHQVRYELRRAGFSDIETIDFRPRLGVYTAYADGRRGRPIFVTIDARTGRILNVDRLQRRGDKYGRGHGAWR